MQDYTKKTFKIYFKHLKKHPKSFLLVVSSIVLASAGGIVIPIFYKDFFNILAGAGDVESKLPGMIHMILMVLLFNVITWVFWRITTFAAGYFQTQSMVSINNSSFEYLHKHSVSFFNNDFTGALVKRVNRFTRAFDGIMEAFYWTFLPAIVSIVFIVIVLWQSNMWMSIGVIVWVVVFSFINYHLSLYKLKHDIKRSEADSKITGFLADTITNNANIKLFSGYKREVKTFAKLNEELRSLRFFSWKLTGVFDAVQALLMILLEFGMLYFAIKLWQRGVLTIGDFFLIQAYVLAIFNRVWNFGRVIRYVYEQIAEAKEMTEILEKPHEIKDARNAKDLQISQAKIELKDVNFSYRRTRRVIKNLNLSIKPKEKLALVGVSGSGKSTLVNLLLRNYDLESGNILIDDQKISCVKQESIWKNIALVNQDPILFHRTLKENIKYGNPGATDAEVVKAAKQAHCHGFISQFSESYQTFVGERGVKLSGGERQRVAIARAILKNAPILILDEATSSLDSDSEQLIQGALANLMKDKTVMVIAHRLSTIRQMDRIVVLDEGQIIEQGTHDELLKKSKGVYKNLWEKQVGGFIK
ncbi:ABC transporter ATP-binding protein [Candidatus Parcubacteria bacterium]|jgi:ATP-binding cassette, subfamily B, bacterial|nr:ABC transporter ATP-binding protein [Candidatus Parcubacteria bacterium]